MYTDTSWSVENVNYEAKKLFDLCEKKKALYTSITFFYKLIPSLFLSLLSKHKQYSLQNDQFYLNFKLN